MKALVDHLWQSLLVCGAIIACAHMTRSSRAILRLWLWRTAALKFLLPFAIIHALGEWLGFPVFYTADPAPPALVAFVGAFAPLFAPARLLQPGQAWSWCVPPVALLTGALCLRGVIARISREQIGVREERERRERDINDVRRCPGFWATTSMLTIALVIVSAPLLSGALADRQRRHELLIANSLSLRQGRISLTVAAPGMGERYRVIADDNGVLIRNANLIEIVAIVYSIHRSVVWTEQRASGDPQARPNFWMISPRYDVQVTAPVQRPGEFDPYALRQPVTKLLAERFGLEINLDNRCQPPCGNYGVAMPADPL